MTIKINVPDIGNKEMEVIEVLIKEGDIIKHKQPLLIAEGDKTSIEVPSPTNGTVEAIKVTIGDKIKTGSLIMTLKEINPLSSPKRTNSNNSKETTDNSYTGSELLNTYTTPKLKRLANKFDIKLDSIKGTGNKGRVLESDIQSYIKSKLKQANETLTNKLSSNMFGNIKEITIKRTQKLLGKALHKSWLTIPHVTQFDEADVTDLERFRIKQNIKLNNKTIKHKVTLLSFLIKIVSKVLKEMPLFNSSIAEDNDKIIYKEYVNIGIAVNTGKELLVPVIRNVDKKDIIELSYDLLEVSNKAKLGKLRNEDFQGGSFTISNLGNIGGSYFTPIVNYPEVAILGVSKTYIKPIWNGNKFIARLIIPISLSYDHRIINGAEGASFIRMLNYIISDIRYLLA